MTLRECLETTRAATCSTKPPIFLPTVT